MATCNTVDLSDAMTLLWKKKCTGQLVEIDPESLPNVNDANVCEAINDCDTIKAMKVKDQQLSNEVANIQTALDEFRSNESDINDRMDTIESTQTSQEDVIDEVNTEISGLKTEYIRVINKIKSLWMHVVLDDHFTTFEDWVENVYVPNADAAVNEYKEWTWYFNTNPSIDSEQSAYINVRKEWDTSEYGINDWYKLPYNLPTLAIIGIDPIKVVHPYRWRFEVGVDPVKLADLISKLDSLDLSDVKVYLGDVYLDWVIKESLHIQEDLTVDNATSTKELTVTHAATIADAAITSWHITSHDAAEIFLDDVQMNADLDVDGDFTGLNATFTNDVACRNVNATTKVTANTVEATQWRIQTHTWNEQFNWNITATGAVNAANMTVTATMTAHDVHATDHLTVDNAATFVISGKDLDTYIRDFCDARYVQR